MASEAFNQWWAEYKAVGDVGIVHLSASRDEVLSWFGEPDDVEATTKRRRIPRIWKYGPVEFHFSELDNLLWLVYTEEPCMEEDADEDCEGISILVRK